MRKKHIYIDFEGEGRKRNGVCPQPSLLGTLVPSMKTGRVAYHCWLLESPLAPIANQEYRRLKSLTQHARQCTFREAIRDICELANKRGGRIAAYSIHELQMVEENLSPRSKERKEFERLYFNAKLAAVELAALRGIELENNSLSTVMQSLVRRYKKTIPPELGAAETCRRLRQAGHQSPLWANWSDEDQLRAIGPLEYNRKDCHDLKQIMNRIDSNLPELTSES